MRDLYSTSSRCSPPLKSFLWFCFFSIHRMWSHPLSLLLLLLLLSSPSSDFVFTYTQNVISSFVPSSSPPPPPLKSLLWFCFFLYTQCDLILCPFFFIFFSSSQVPPLIFFFFLHTMWSLSSFVPCVKMINTKLSSPSSDFVFFYTHNVISLILRPSYKNDQYKALKSFLRFCFFFLYTQCDLSHPLSLVSKWSIQSSQVIPPILFFFSYTHNVISLILCPLCQNDQYKRYPLKI